MATIKIIVSTSNYFQRRWEKHKSELFSRIIFARTSIYYCMDASYLIHDFSGGKSSKAGYKQSTITILGRNIYLVRL